MNRLILFIQGLDRKALLLAIGALLLLFNLGRLAWGTYEGQLEELQAQRGLLDQYQETVSSLPVLKKKVARLQQRANQLKKGLFVAASEEEVSSIMQIMLQELVTKSGLAPESIRPLVTGGKSAPRDFHEIAIKIRLSGTMNQFMAFISDLYRSDRLFRIESFTLKPYKKAEMKVFLDIKGYYALSGQPATE
ncbi:MAG: type II secretion system protein GspM [Thermodesulfobacteriota bacterium]